MFLVVSLKTFQSRIIKFVYYKKNKDDDNKINLDITIIQLNTTTIKKVK